ncbi:unnamed protein product [Gongylonema pulchrum]|uniref:Nudix hydrolase domain-containing protein n=1 Tax=Gongylonema pulchrum TaxID=637853 RepID=A0A183D8C2_9BILA|nr:unnamed protein product [Gongylonema pulchrum]
MLLWRDRQGLACKGHQESAFSGQYICLGLPNGEQLLDILKRTGQRKWEEIDPSCGIYRHEALHAVMDRVCELCHEMFSHEQNSLRAECRFVYFSSRIRFGTPRRHPHAT